VTESAQRALLMLCTMFQRWDALVSTINKVGQTAGNN
jgi:hypothetical protein